MLVLLLSVKYEVNVIWVIKWKYL